jgi:hypothetical protein
LADSVARLVNAATVEAALAVPLGIELEALPVPLTLLIDIMIPIATNSIHAIGREAKNLRGFYG